MLPGVFGQAQVFATAPHHTQHIELDGHLPELGSEVVSFFLDFWKLKRKHIPGALYTDISGGRWRVSFCVTHGLDHGASSAQTLNL